MAQTFRDRNIYEVALLVFSHHHNGTNERAQEGDIIAVRKPFGHGEIGRGERSRFLWLRLESVDQIDNLNLTQSLEEGGVRYDKRRYCIPFARLKTIVPSVDLVRIRDKADPYQPFMGGIDRDQDYDVYTFTGAMAEMMVIEGKTFAEADAVLAPLRRAVRIKRLGHVNALDDNKLRTLEIYRRHSDQSFALNLAGEQTGGHYLSPRAPLFLEGLVFDKATQRYL